MAFTPMQVPLIAKQPALKSKPLSAVLVAPDDSWNEPPVIESPDDDSRPSAVIPELKVEEAESCAPPTFNTPRIDDEAFMVSTVKTELEAELIIRKALAVSINV